ncbi:MAG: hypothetical protein JNJ46_02700 [Myxococcales bacterium]|nr:hypothetical protein [Myxococcales bacterium]
MHVPTHTRFLLALLPVVLLPLPVRSDWPMARQDGRRSGAAQGTSDLKSPVPDWRTYLGGSLQPQQLPSISTPMGALRSPIARPSIPCSRIAWLRVDHSSTCSTRI